MSGSVPYERVRGFRSKNLSFWSKSFGVALIALPVNGFVIATALAALERPLLPLYTGLITSDYGSCLHHHNAGQHRSRNDSLMTLSLRPATPVIEVEAAVFFLVDGRIYRSTVTPEISGSGSARVRGTPTELFGINAGTIDVALVVSREGEMPDPSDVFAKRPGQGRWYAAQKTVRVYQHGG